MSGAGFEKKGFRDTHMLQTSSNSVHEYTKTIEPYEWDGARVLGRATIILDRGVEKRHAWQSSDSVRERNHVHHHGMWDRCRQSSFIKKMVRKHRDVRISADQIKKIQAVDIAWHVEKRSRRIYHKKCGSHTNI